MILEQLYLGCLSQASYLVGDEAAGVAAVVDPRRDVDEYLEQAERLGVRIEHVILTHFHADFVSGHLELRERTGATIHLGAAGKARFPHHPVSDGDVIRLGTVELRILETPGHTPESISIVVTDTATSPAPHAVLTGDTLFIGDVGRPDLMASVGVSAEELASSLYDSLHGKLLPLPDATLVFPGHGAGSMCGKNLSRETVSTMGDQRKLNYALQPMTKEAFIAEVTADQPESPAYFAFDADLNKKDRPTLDEQMKVSLTPLTLEQVLSMQAEGAQLLDVRDPSDYTFGHLKGSVNIGLGGQYATWAGTLLDLHAPIILLAHAGQEEEAATRLGRIGFDHVVGYLENGVEPALVARPDLAVQVERITADQLHQRLGAGGAPLVLDVRQPGEWQTRHIPGAQHIPLTQLPKRLAEVPRDRTLVVQCAGGYRSCIAMSLLLRDGHTGLTDLVGGIGAWVQAGYPVEEPQGAR